MLAGEAGIGKSRLLRELAARSEDRGGLALVGACLRLGDSPMPFVPIAEIVRPLARSPDAEVRRALDGARADLAALVPSLAGEGADHAVSADAVDGSRPDANAPPSRDLTESSARARLFEGILALAGRLAVRRPVLLGIEDVHWSDPATRDLVTFLARNLVEERILVVLTLRTDGLSRADPVVGWLAELLRVLAAERIDLDRLVVDDVGRQVEAITGRAPTAESLRTIWQRSEGNPFFVEELVASGAAGRPEDAIRLDLGASVPRTLAEVLLSRVAVLSASARGVVRAVAVAGVPVEEGVLDAALDLGAAELVAALREPIDAGLLRVDEAGRVRPRHALLGEIVEASLLAGERRALHEALATALDAAPAGAGEAAAAISAARARHWLAADRLPEAYRASLDAADAASAVFAHEEAAGHLALALDLGPRLSPPASVEARVALLLRAVDASDLAGDAATAIDHVVEALALVDEGGDAVAAGSLYSKLGYLRWVSGQGEAAFEAHRRAVALVPPEPPSPERARVLAALGGALMGAGRYAESRTICEEAVRVAERSGATSEESRARNMLGSDLVALGQVDDGLAQLRGARRLAGLGGPRDLLVVAHHNLALNLLLADHRDEAVREALAGRDLARRVGLERRYAPHLVGVAADALYRSGRWTEAAILADEMLAVVPASRATLHLVAVRARLHAGRGESEEAAALLAEAAATDGNDIDPDLGAYLALASAEVAFAAGAVGDALAAARAGLAALEGSDDETSRLPLLAAAARALAELAEDARAGRDAVDAASAATEARSLAEEAGRIAGRLQTPAAAALAARAAADAGRAAGEPAVTAWQDAVDAADGGGLGALAAEARLGLADALLRSRGDRSLAESALRAAATAASALGARPLAATIGALARRARVDLSPSSGGPGAAGSPASATGVSGLVVGETSKAAGTRAPRASSLSERELEVLRLVAEGRTNGQIAEVLFITRKTASAHVTHILDKLGVSNRLEAAMVASRLGLLPPSFDDRRTEP